MPSLNVICPKCYKGQQVVGEIPPSGVDHPCLYCKTTFRVRAATSTDADNLPIPREAIPRPTDLPVARESMPRMTDLPVARESLPRPTDLPVSRDASPRATDLPVSRESVPRPGDLPVSRESVPRPGDLPVPRESVPRPGDLPVSRESAPRPTDLLASRDTVPRPDDLLVSKSSPPPLFPPRQPAKTPPLGMAVDAADPLGSSLFDFEGLPPPPPREKGNDSAKGPQSAPPPFPSSARAPLNLQPLVSQSESQETGHVLPNRASGGAHSDMALGLDFDGHKAPATESSNASILPPLQTRVANDGIAERALIESGVPALAPPSPRRSTAPKAMRATTRRLVIPRWAYFAGGGVGVLVLGVVLVLPLLRRAPTPDTVLAPLSAELAMDNLAAYEKAARLLIAAGGAEDKEGTEALRIRAAELLLTASALHGESDGKIARAEELIAGATPKKDMAAALARVRALLAILKGKARDSERLLTDKDAPESLLVMGLARVAEGKNSSAVEVLKRYASQRPQDLAGHYLSGRALKDTSPSEAHAAFSVIASRNPAHGGAQVMLASLEDSAPKRLLAAQKLVDAKVPGLGPREWAELHTVIGQAHLEMGRIQEAVAALQRAVSHDSMHLTAQILLGEALLYLGQYDEALRRLKIPGDAVLMDPSGKFALAGALLTTANGEQGMALLKAAMKASPKDPRGPYWLGYSATSLAPPDLAAAENHYRESLKLDAKFLPATLALTGLLRQAKKTDESMKVLSEAEAAGVPSQMLQMAWAATLLSAGDPAKAETVYRKILATEAGSVTATLGVAAALEAQKKLAEAKLFLEGAYKTNKAMPGIVVRLAELALQLGQKEEALLRYTEEIKAGNAPVATRLAAARLALDLNQYDRVKDETRKVLDIESRNAEAVYLMARVHEARGEKGPAMNEFRRAVTWSPTPIYALAYAQMLIKLGKEQESQSYLDMAEALPHARLERGRLLFRRGDLEKALADFRAAGEGIANQADPFLLQGHCYEKMGEKEKAEAAWKAALRADPNAAESYYRLGRHEMDRGKPKTAIDYLRKSAAKLSEKSSWEGELYFQLGQAEYLAGSKPAALHAFQKFLEVAPADAPARPEAELQVARLSGKR